MTKMHNSLLVSLMLVFSTASIANQPQNLWPDDSEKFECVFSGIDLNGQNISLLVDGLGDGMYESPRPDAAYVKGRSFGESENDLTRGSALASIMVNPPSSEVSARLTFGVGFDGKKLSIFWKYLGGNGENLFFAEADASLNKFSRNGRKLNLSADITGLTLQHGTSEVTQVSAKCSTTPSDY